MANALGYLELYLFMPYAVSLTFSFPDCIRPFDASDARIDPFLTLITSIIVLLNWNNRSEGACKAEA